MKSVLVKVVLVAAVAVPIAQVRGDDEKKSENSKTENRVEVKVDGNRPRVRVFLNDNGDGPTGKQPYLGVVIEPVPAALAAHLPNVLTLDEGLLVADVADDSPAAKAGLRQHDILLTYNDQKLLSGEQLTKLVRGDGVGTEVTLGIIRAGKSEKVKVTVGEHEVKAGPFDFGRGRILVDPQGRREALRILKDLEGKTAKAGASVKSSFSSMRLESLDGDRFKAEIEYKNEKGDSLKRSFEGTRDEIRKQIEADEEMPEGIRNQLLRSVDLGKGGRGTFQFGIPRGGFAFDFDSDGFPAFTWPGSKDFDQVMEQLSNEIDPELREKLKGALRSIEEQQPRKQPVPRNRSL
jgi:hypothetical protein